MPQRGNAASQHHRRQRQNQERQKRLEQERRRHEKERQYRGRTPRTGRRQGSPLSGPVRLLAGLGFVAWFIWYRAGGIDGFSTGEWATEFALAGAMVGVIAYASRRLWLPSVRWYTSRRRRMAEGREADARGVPRTQTPGKRSPLPPKLRFEVLHRDGFRCRYCGRGQDDGVQLHVDHLVPVAAGGSDDKDNLVASCADCNFGKSATEII